MNLSFFSFYWIDSTNCYYRFLLIYLKKRANLYTIERYFLQERGEKAHLCYTLEVLSHTGIRKSDIITHHRGQNVGRGNLGRSCGGYSILGLP